MENVHICELNKEGPQVRGILIYSAGQGFFTTLWVKAEEDTFVPFTKNRFWHFFANCLHQRQFARNVKTCFLWKIKTNIKMSSAES